MRHKSGNWVWIQCTGLQMVGASGNLARVIGIHIDATERKETEEAGLVSDSRLRLSGGRGSVAGIRAGFSGGRLLVFRGVAAADGRDSRTGGRCARPLTEALGPTVCPSGFETWSARVQSPGTVVVFRACPPSHKRWEVGRRTPWPESDSHPETHACARRRLRLPDARGVRRNAGADGAHFAGHLRRSALRRLFRRRIIATDARGARPCSPTRRGVKRLSSASPWPEWRASRWTRCSRSWTARAESQATIPRTGPSPQAARCP